MAVTAVWCGILAAGVGWELVCRSHGGLWASASGAARSLWGHPVGRVALLVVWAFVGVHLFARDTPQR
ncbi:MAG: DUF6186 family protein [Actinomycetota bacterium]|nr:DUF6186 family protein [Actinomycetota bacterium]